MKISMLQMTATPEPAENLKFLIHSMNGASGADILLTPEVSNCLAANRDQQREVLEPWENNRFISGVQNEAAKLGMWVLLGSVAIKTDDSDGRFANRSTLINANGDIVAWYDKIHMCDITTPDGKNYRESYDFRPGNRAVVADTPWFKLGMTICYDLRFPQLYRDLAQAGAQIITVPSAFTVPTGAAHWEALLRARAIETGCYIMAPAQTGTHPISNRQTYGHSLVVGPWGKVLTDMGDTPGLKIFEVPLDRVDITRKHIPSLNNSAPYELEHQNGHPTV